MTHSAKCDPLLDRILSSSQMRRSIVILCPICCIKMATNGVVPAVLEPPQPGMEWKDSPVFKGSTKFEPLQDVQNIMITGGAGFMLVNLFPAVAANANTDL